MKKVEILDQRVERPSTVIKRGVSCRALVFVWFVKLWEIGIHREDVELFLG